MATWTAEKRRKLPRSQMGDPDHMAFPIADQEDLDNSARLIGHSPNPAKVKARLIAIAKRLGLKLPKSWQDETDAKMSDGDPVSGHDDESIAAFDLGTETETNDSDEIIYKNSLLFKVGNYPDKAFDLSTEEAWLAVERFSGPLKNELEHVNSSGITTILDGRLGEVRSIRLSDDGQELRGDVAIPTWLDALWEGPKAVSTVWDREGKNLKKLGLVMKGRVDGAVLMAAFSAAHPDDAEALFTVANQSPHGRAMLQQVHDLVVTGGAICSPANSPSANPEPSLTDPPAFTARIERSILQTIHNQAVRGGASCVIAPRGTVAMAAEPTSSSPAPDATVGNRAPAPPHASARTGAGVPPRKRGISMGLKDSFMALFGSQTEAAPDEARVDAFLAELTTTMQPPKLQVPDPAAFCADEAAVKAKDARIAELEHKLNQLTEKSGNPASFADSPEAKALLLKIEEANAKIVEQDRKAFVREVGLAAAAFADGEIKECRALPAERADLVVLFTQAMLDDAEHATAVTFGADGQPVTTPRVATLKALYAKRPKHSLMREFIRAEDMPPGSSVLFHQAEAPKNGKPTQERIDELLSKTPEGLQAIKLRNRGA